MVKAQTIEAINHAKAANCPIIVAVNKCDKPDADPLRVRNDLLQYEIVTEDYGGDILCVDVSAHTGSGLDKLEEAMMLQTELLELKANPDRAAEGTVVEAKVERGRGQWPPFWSSAAHYGLVIFLSAVLNQAVCAPCSMTEASNRNRPCRSAG